MKKTFKLSGLDCANCAAQMERLINGVDGVESATVNFMTTKLVIQVDDEKMAEVIEAIKRIVKKVEPHVEVRSA